MGDVEPNFNRCSSANYVNFGRGFGGVRHGFNSPNTRQSTFTPALPRMSSYYRHRRSISPRMAEIEDDMEQNSPTSSRYHTSNSREVDMSDIDSSVETINCPMVDQSANGGTRRTFTREDSARSFGFQGTAADLFATVMNPLGNYPLQYTQSKRVPYRPRSSIHTLLNPELPFSSPRVSTGQ
jgi:hypothetical protein